MSPAEAETVDDCAVTCRQIAELLDTVVDAQPQPDAQLTDSLTAIGRLAKHTSERLRAVAI